MIRRDSIKGIIVGTVQFYPGKRSIFSILRRLGLFNQEIRIPWNNKNVLWEVGGGSVQSYKEWSFFSIFSRLRLFPQVYGQLKEWLILELREMIRVAHVVALPIDFSLLCDRGQQGGLLKPTKNDYFHVFLAFWVLFLKFVSRLRRRIYWNNMKW